MIDVVETQTKFLCRKNGYLLRSTEINDEKFWDIC